jgi:hypothetical protein
MAASAPSNAADFSHRIVQLQILTMEWMTAEASLSFGSAWRANGPVLFAFGGTV